MTFRKFIDKVHNCMIIIEMTVFGDMFSVIIVQNLVDYLHKKNKTISKQSDD